MASIIESLIGRFSANTRRNIYVYANNVPQQQSFESRDFSQLASLYTTLVEIRIIEDYVSNAISKIPVKVMKGNREVKGMTPLHLLIDKANPTQSWQEVSKEALVWFGLTGNLFLTMQDEYFYSLSSAEMKINLGLPVHLPEYQNYIQGYSIETMGEYYDLPIDTVFHMKTSQLNSANGMWVWGSSPYSAAIPNIETLEANYSARVSMIQDRGALGILTNKSQIPDKAATKEVQDALSEYGITKGKKKYIATPEQLEWQQMSLNVEELKLIEQLGTDFAKLCQLRGIDPVIFSAENSTYANQAEAEVGTLKRAIVPVATQFYGKLEEFTKQHFSGHYFAPDLEAIPELQELGTEQSAKIISEVQAGLLTKEQAMEILYPDMTFEGESEEETKERMNNQFTQAREEADLKEAVNE